MLASGCDVDPPRFELDVPRVLATSPAEGERDVPRRGEYVVWVDRRLAPGTVTRQTVSVVSGGASLVLSVRFDPVESAIIAVPYDRNAQLVPGVQYRLVVDGARDLDDVALPKVEVRFVIGDEPGTVPSERFAAWAEVAPIFERHCAMCHVGAGAPLGLDLSNADAVRATAINVTNRGLPSLVGAEGGAGSSTLAGLPRIDAVAGRGRPEGSYLLYKVLGDPHCAGARMPRTVLSDPRNALSDADTRPLAAWIAAGAPTP